MVIPKVVFTRLFQPEMDTHRMENVLKIKEPVYPKLQLDLSYRITKYKRATESVKSREKLWHIN